MTPAVRDFAKLFQGIPKGSWVAISPDEERVLAHGFDLNEVIQAAGRASDENPILTRVPETDSALVL
jgi:Aspartyl protease